MKTHSELFGLMNRHMNNSGCLTLPLELIRIIVEIAAADSRSTAATLSLVSKCIRLWTKTILYHTVVLSTPKQLALFHTVTLRSDPTVVQLITNLFLRSMSIPSCLHAAGILSTCTNVERLVVDTLFREPFLDEKRSWPKLWEIVDIYGGLAWLRANHPSLTRVTHFHMDDVLFNSTIDICASLPCLTHLGMTHLKVKNGDVVYDEKFIQFIDRVLATSTTLKMLLVQLQPIKGAIPEGLVGPYDIRPSIWEELVSNTDERLLARPALDAEEYLTVLETGRTIWDDADSKFADWRLLR